MASNTDRNKCESSCSKGNNVLTILIPGLKRPIDIQFPHGKLPVCQRCKKIFKSRELCRTRDGHTGIPWNTTYICVSFDDTCLTLNSVGKVCLVDEERMQCQYIARLLSDPPLPLRANIFHGDDILCSPICTACKEKSYTRHRCRESKQHMELPWVTTYVMLSTIPHYEPVNQMGIGGSDHNGAVIISDTPSLSQTSECGVSLGDRSKKDFRINYIGGDKSAGKVFIDDIQDVPSSRSCVLTITSSLSTLHWLEIDPCFPRTEYRSISSFTGTPSSTMNQRYDMNNPNPCVLVTRSTYSPREPMPMPGYTLNQKYHTGNSYYPRFPQSAEYQGCGPPMCGQGPPGTPYNYPPDYFNVYQYQQMEHARRQLCGVGHEQHKFPLENTNCATQEMSNGGYCNIYYDHNYVPHSQAKSSARPGPSEQHPRSFDQGKS